MSVVSHPVLITLAGETTFIKGRFVIQVIYERCAAIDVHQKTAVTTVLLLNTISAGDGPDPSLHVSYH